MLIKRTERQARRGTLADAFAGQTQGRLDRRTFLRRSGLTVGGLAAVGALPLATVRKADAAGSMATSGATIRKNICTHCSVGCTVIAEVVNGVWVGQEPGWDSPISRGSHCAKGAATRELVHGEVTALQPRRVQTDLRLSFGGAGGPVFSDSGAVVGLTSMSTEPGSTPGRSALRTYRSASRYRSTGITRGPDRAPSRPDVSRSNSAKGSKVIAMMMIPSSVVIVESLRLNLRII